MGKKNRKKTKKLKTNPKKKNSINAPVSFGAADTVETTWRTAVQFHKAGRFGEAEAAYRAVLKSSPLHVGAHNNLGNLLKQLERLNDALPHLQYAAHKTPGLNAKTVYADCLMKLRFTVPNSGIEKDIITAINTPWARPSRLVGCALSVLGLHTDISAVLSYAQTGIRPADLMGHPGFLSAINHPLFLTLLKSTVICDRRVEGFLTLARRGLLSVVIKKRPKPTDQQVLPFACALAMNCFINEYAFAQTAVEDQTITALRREISIKLEEGEKVRLLEIVMLAAYTPLIKLAGAEILLGLKGQRDFEALIAMQVREPLEERRLAEEISAHTIIKNAVSRKVQAQYQENPYPRWIKTVLRDDPHPFDTWFKQKFPFVDCPIKDSQRLVSILMAGCGTGQYAVEMANEIKNADCLAVDLSRASLAYALRKTSAYGIKNLTFAQADILELKKLDRRFDFIESSGVLHHLEDPLSGWKILVDKLKPNGLMRIGLYSKVARERLDPIRAYIKKRGYTTLPEDIRAFRADILSMADEDPDLAGVLDWNDFYSLSEARDLVFHVKEHFFTIPQIRQVLDALGLVFMGFNVSSLVANLYRDRFPGDTRMLNLESWHQLEKDNRMIFKGMYQFWAIKLMTLGNNLQSGSFK